MTSGTAELDFADRLVADIAATIPGATAVFRRHKMDFCCGGKAPLAEAAAKAKIPLFLLERELAALDRGETAGAFSLPTPDLIGLIETRFHAVHRAELPELYRLARRVEAVHGANPHAPLGLADLLAVIQGEMEQHMGKEEQILFPMMRAGGHPMISAPIGVMLSEHDDHGAQLHRLEELTDHFSPPEGACTTWRALYAGLSKFADDLMEHIHTENNILFPRFTAKPA
jgi:regulator of cell morphogenesis and NO signaling